MSLLLVSHALCPYVQRAAIALTEKGAAFERIDVDLADKPDWFKTTSPLGKTPVLIAQCAPIFDSAQSPAEGCHPVMRLPRSSGVKPTDLGVT